MARLHGRIGRLLLPEPNGWAGRRGDQDRRIVAAAGSGSVRCDECRRAIVQFGPRFVTKSGQRDQSSFSIYREEQLQLRSKLPRRRKMVMARRERFQPRASNDVWSLDFVSDQLADGTRFRALTVVDVFTREALAIKVGQRLRGEQVVGGLNRLAAQRQAPNYLFVDNGSEFSVQLHHYT